MTKFKFLFLLVVVFISTSVRAQYSNKEDIYLNFKGENENCHISKAKLKRQKKKGTYFNLCEKGVVLQLKTSVADTLSLHQFNDIGFTAVKDIDKRIQTWRESNHDALRDHYKGVYPKFDKNSMFNTFLVEVLDVQNCIVVYPVIWPNEGVLALK